MDLQQFRTAFEKNETIKIPDDFHPLTDWNKLIEEVDEKIVNELKIIIEATRLAAFIASQVLGHPIEASEKANPTDVVSELDRINNDVIFKLIQALNCATIFEENDPTHANLDKLNRYISCDGIDGSKAAARGTIHGRKPFAAVMLAAGDTNKELGKASPADIAVVDVTAHQKTIVAVKGHGVWINGQKVNPVEQITDPKKPKKISINGYPSKDRSKFMQKLREKLTANGIEIVETDASSLDPLRFIDQDLSNIVQDVENKNAIAHQIDLHIHESHLPKPKQGDWDYLPIQLIIQENGLEFKSLTHPNTEVNGLTPIVSGPRQYTNWLDAFIQNDPELQALI